MARTDYHKRRVPLELQGVVIDGRKLAKAVYVPLRDGMTKAKAVAHTEDVIGRAKKLVNFKLTDSDAWELATSICNAYDELGNTIREKGGHWDPDLVIPGRGPDTRGWLKRMERRFSFEDEAKVAQWVERVWLQRFRLEVARNLITIDDPAALQGTGRPERVVKDCSSTKLVQSIRLAAGKTPLHSEVVREYFASGSRPHNYRRALEQFREQCGDLEVHHYTADHCWKFRNWLNDTLDEKKGEPLAGQTKNNKLSAVSSVFAFTIERRYRNDNPMRDVKLYPKNENRKKHRRLYNKDELSALFVTGQREEEWQFWSPLLGLFAGLRLRESLQLRPFDVSDEFEVWHLIIRPGRGQRVKTGRARVVPIHRELIRLGFLDLVKRAKNDGREWLFRDVPLVAKPGRDFNAPDVETILVPSQNAGTQWFGRYSDGCGVSDRNLDFHALRGALITYGSQQGQDVSLRMEIAGHSKGSGVHQTYIYAGASLKKLKAEIDAISYPIRIPAGGK